MSKIYPVIIVGGGQAGLSAAYFLRRKKIDYLVLDANKAPGGSWHNTWSSLRLFSPSEYSSLSGWAMPKTEQEYPTKHEFIDYLTQYESRYGFPVQRQTTVLAIYRNSESGVFQLETNQGNLYAQAIVMATGTASGARIPLYPGGERFQGEQLHSVAYEGIESFIDKKVLVVGAGNTGAQIFSELAEVAQVTWTSNHLPEYLPDHLDGRYLFAGATQKFLAIKNAGAAVEQGSDINTKQKENSKAEQGTEPKVNLANIVMVESVRKARDKGLLKSRIADFTIQEKGVVWGDGSQQDFDTIIWATGFKSKLKMLEPLGIVRDGRVRTEETRALDIDGLWLIGLGDWTGFASATIYGVGKTAREMSHQVASYLDKRRKSASVEESV